MSGSSELESSWCQHYLPSSKKRIGKRLAYIAENLKGTVSRDFSSPVFFLKQFLLVPIYTSRNYFEFFQIFVELFLFVFDSPVMNTPGSHDSTKVNTSASIDSPVYSPPGSQIRIGITPQIEITPRW